MGRLTIKFHFVALVGAFAATVLATEAYNDWTFRRYRTTAAFEDAHTVLSILKSEETRMTGGVKNLLLGIAADASDMTNSHGGCRRLEAIIKGRYMGRLRLWVLDSQDRVLCATDLADAIPARALAAASKATVSHSLIAGQLVPAGGGHGTSLPFARAWEAADGRSGSVLALIDLLWMEDVYSHRPLPDIASGALVAADGILLMSWPQLKDGEPWSSVGAPEADGASVEWQDGVQRFTRTAPIDPMDPAGAYMVAGVSVKKALGPFIAAEMRTWVFGLLSLLGCIAAATWNLNRSVIKPLQAITMVARRIGSGDRNARISASGTAEVEALAREINEMGIALEEAETLREAARQRAEEADRAKTRFLAATSHDLRQPLQAATMYASLLASHTRGTPSARVCEKMETSLTALNSLLSALLDTAQLESGAVQPRMTTFPISALLDELRTVYTPVAAAKGLSFTVVPNDVCIQSDRILLSRIVRNLVENAVRYTERGRVMVDCFPVHDGELAIEVRDTGIGIPQDKFQAVWEEFTQLSNPERKREGGIGLGLNIVRKLSQVLGHPVTMHSQLGTGSTFTLSVPIVSGIPVRPAAGVLFQPGLREGTRVLIIDDDADASDALQGLLESWGAICEVAADGPAAVRHSEEFRPDLVISDYRLPGMTGTSAIEAVRKGLGRRVPAILLTGDIGSIPERDAADVGAELVHKPASSDRLARACRSALPANA